MQPNNLLAGGPGSGFITNPTFNGTLLGGLTTLTDPTAFFNIILPNAITLCFIVASVIFVFMIITGAIQWIASGGDKQALESARGKITSALLGLVILFSLFAILSLIQTFFGIKILTLDIGPLVIQ